MNGINGTPLIPGEMNLLDALADQRPRNSIEIAELTELEPFRVRSIARALVQRGLIRRRTDREHVGSWEITIYGLEHLNRYQQLRLV